MKKILISAAASIFLFSPFAFSADNAAEAIESTTPIVLTDCSLLQDDVTLTLSNGVLGAYNCVTAANSVLVATCHASGRSASRSIDIPCVNTFSADPDVAATQTICEDTTIAFNRQTASGAAIFLGNTAGGAIGPDELDESVCTAAALAGKL
jgi:hypothetical protein